MIAFGAHAIGLPARLTIYDAIRQLTNSGGDRIPDQERPV